jgi:uncharacterized protein YndB with AHSA1/START domain
VLEVIREVDAPAERVWDVLSDGWSYAGWVVGASRMRAVDATWPAAGAKLHHSAGLWPVVLNDETVVKESDPGRRLVLLARGRPFGEAVIEFLLEPDGDRPGRTTVRLREDAVSGPGRLVPAPVRQVLIGGRNTETLRRLAYLAEGRNDPTDGAGPDAGTRESLAKSKIEEA